jgi:beta-galactosidase
LKSGIILYECSYIVLQYKERSNNKNIFQGGRSSMNRQNLDRQWRFMPANSSNTWWLVPESTMVDLPHDFSIAQKREPHSPGGPSNGYFPGGVAVYEKTLFVPADWKGKNIVLEFEGIYMNATVRFNNQIVAQHPYGYTSFHCDLTPYLLYDRENIIRVTVNNGALPNTRWYSGSGIYRHVWLMVGESVNITPWGIFATTPEATSNASTVSVKTTVQNSGKSAADVIVRSTIVSACGCETAIDETELTVATGSTAEIAQLLRLAPANLWSVENPYLYTLRSEILRDGTVIDSTETPIGIRSISYDVTNGFQLNGITMKMKGGCVHHDCGLIGSAAYDRAEERKVELLKASGFNAVRCAHNPPSPAFLDACDRLGMLVIDEAFDCWRESKNPNDYGVCFEDWWERDMASMILRDRNHPSVIMWSTGNEIVERDGRSEGYAYACKLAAFVRSLDPTRATTNALCGIGADPMVSGLAANMTVIPDGYDYWGELSFRFVEPLDVVGYNYLRDRYESDAKKYPDRIICGTETFPKEAFEYWEAVEQQPNVIGDFVWTSLDYLGEAGIGHVWYNGEKDWLGKYPWHHAFCGDIDICGFKRPQSYYRDCVWGISKAPYIAVYKPENHGKTPVISLWGWPDVVSSWTWPGYEGKPTVVDIYSTNDEVELMLNGSTLGRKPAGKANRYTASFDVTYEGGELVAIGYENGVEASRTILQTAGAPAAIRLTPDRGMLRAQFGDLSYVTVEVLDKNGNVVHNADNNVYFTAHGAGSLLAVGNGNPLSEEMYVGNQRRVHEGRAMVVVRTSGEAGEIVLTAAADGVPPASVSIRVE